jgi:hypothetical protein
MPGAMTLMMVVAGMFFSFCCALLLEELLFGGLFYLFFGTARARAYRQARTAPQATAESARSGR